ncbi:hypothetical protein Angca_001657, partial [Angiostrongylus cantonensis]
VVDETVVTNPRSFDYDFADDLLHVADKNDLYDELLYQLPPFNLYKLGIDRGTTRASHFLFRAFLVQWDTWYTKAASISELRVFAPTTPSPRLSTITIKNVFQKRSRNSNAGRSFLNSFTKKTEIDHAALLTTSIPMESLAQLTQTTWKKEKQITTGWSSPASFTKKTVIDKSHVAALTTSIPIESSAQPTQPSEKNGRQTTSRRSTLTSFRKKPKYAKYHAALLNRSIPVESSTRSSFNSFTKKTKIDKSHAAFPSTSVPLKSFTQSILTTAVLKKRQSIKHFSSLVRNKLQFSKSTKKIKEVISTTVPTLLTSSTFLLRSVSFFRPTFNCRVLNAYNDGNATEHHDPSCTMVFPGLSKDGSCRCYYKVSSRDEYGCAVGFLYACKPLWNRSVVV